MCHQGPGHPAANNRHTRFMFTGERGVSPVCSDGALQPQRPAAAECSLRRAHQEADAGSASHTRSHSGGPQLMILSLAIGVVAHSTSESGDSAGPEMT
jgi:hypothetical protein